MNAIEYKRMFDAEENHWWYVSLHEQICSFIAAERLKRGKPLHILDVGCGTGRLMQLMKPYGRVEGFDMADLAMEFCAQRGLENISKANLNDVTLEESRYDVITSIDVIYHRGVYDESAVFNRLRRALRPGGLLIINLVAFEFLRSTHDLAVHTRRRYTRDELMTMLAGCGFIVETSSYRNAFLFLPIALYRLARRVLPHSKNVASDVHSPSPLVNIPLLLISRVENRLQRRFSLPFGTSVFMVARRPPQPVDS